MSQGSRRNQGDRGGEITVPAESIEEKYSDPIFQWHPEAMGKDAPEQRRLFEALVEAAQRR